MIYLSTETFLNFRSHLTYFSFEQSLSRGVFSFQVMYPSIAQYSDYVSLQVHPCGKAWFDALPSLYVPQMDGCSTMDFCFYFHVSVPNEL